MLRVTDNKKDFVLINLIFCINAWICFVCDIKSDFLDALMLILLVGIVIETFLKTILEENVFSQLTVLLITITHGFYYFWGRY